MKTNKIALSGILLGLNMIVLFGATMLPGIELSLFALSSFITAIVVVKASPKSGLLFFMASVLLGAIILPNKLALLPYGLFFGYYGIVKYYIEKIRLSRVVEVLLKVGVFVVAFGGGLLIFKEAFVSGISLPDLPMPLIGGAAIIAFLAYDYVYTLMIPQIKRVIKT